MSLKLINIFLLFRIGSSITGSTCNHNIDDCLTNDDCTRYGSMKSILDDRLQPKCNLQTNNCVCDIAGYNKYSCLPDINGCTICMTTQSKQSELDELAKFPGYAYSSGGYGMYYCFNTMIDYNTLGKEIRVVSVHEPIHPGTININLRTCSQMQILTKPIIFLLSSYDPVEWIISSDDQYVIENSQIDTIHVLSYYNNQTSVSIDKNLQILNDIQIEYIYSSEFNAAGFGDDSGGGDTALMLYHIPFIFGDAAYSFIGQYQTDKIDVCVGYQGTNNLVKVNINDTFVGNPTSTDALYLISDGCIKPNICRNYNNESYTEVCNNDGTVSKMTYFEPNCTGGNWMSSSTNVLIDCYEECTDYIQYNLYTLPLNQTDCHIKIDAPESYISIDSLIEPYGCQPVSENVSFNITCQKDHTVIYEIYLSNVVNCSGEPDIYYELNNKECNDISVTYLGKISEARIYLDLEYCPSSGSIYNIKIALFCCCWFLFVIL